MKQIIYLIVTLILTFGLTVNFVSAEETHVYSSDLLLYEGFEYASEVSLDAVQSNKDQGWNGNWSVTKSDDTTATVYAKTVQDGLSYEAVEMKNTGGGALIHSSNSPKTTNVAIIRNLDPGLFSQNGDYYLSFLYMHDNQTTGFGALYGEYGDVTKPLVGVKSVKNTMVQYSSPSNDKASWINVKSKLPTNAVSMFLAKITLSDTGTNVSIWYDPIFTNGELSNADVSYTLSQRIAPTSFKAYSENGFQYKGFYIDEIRIAKTLNAVLGATLPKSSCVKADQIGLYLNETKVSGEQIELSDSYTAKAFLYNAVPESGQKRAYMIAAMYDENNDMTDVCLKEVLLSEGEMSEESMPVEIPEDKRSDVKRIKLMIINDITIASSCYFDEIWLAAAAE